MIGQSQWNGKTFYISDLPGQGGVDWGWTDKTSKAIELTPYWQKRFAASRRAVGAQYQLLDIAGIAKNPRPRLGTAKPMRKSSATGKKPSARLIARRKANRIPGVYPNPADRRGAYWVFTIRDGYVSFRTDSGHTGSTPFAAIPGWKREADTGAAYARWVGLKRGQYEVLDDRTKRNPDIHIDIGSHNASRSRKVRTNPARKTAKMRYTVQSEFGSQWRDIAQCDDLATAKAIARDYAKKHYGAVRVITA